MIPRNDLKISKLSSDFQEQRLVLDDVDKKYIIQIDNLLNELNSSIEKKNLSIDHLRELTEIVEKSKIIQFCHR